MHMTRCGLLQGVTAAIALAHPVGARAASMYTPAACVDNTPHRIGFVD